MSWFPVLLLSFHLHNIYRIGRVSSVGGGPNYRAGGRGASKILGRGWGGVVSRQQPLWGVRERGTRDDFENMDREIRHLQCISGIFVFPKGLCNPLNLPPGSAPERDVGSSC